MCIEKIFLTAAFGLLFVSVRAQEDYRKIFSTDYDKAIQFLKTESGWMDEIILANKLKPREVKAIIFPELMRFNSIQDKIETLALESLYIQYGKAYANFSIGPFQIKPSFAENIEIDYQRIMVESAGITSIINASDTFQTISARKSRVKRLKDKKATVDYICSFFKIVQQKHPTLKTDEERIKFFAAAYNSDYRKPEKEIKEFVAKKFFQTGLIPSKKYSYADIAWYYYDQGSSSHED